MIESSESVTKPRREIKFRSQTPEAQREYYLANRERKIAQVAAWKRANRDKSRAHARAIHARERESKPLLNNYPLAPKPAQWLAMQWDAIPEGDRAMVARIMVAIITKPTMTPSEYYLANKEHLDAKSRAYQKAKYAAMTPEQKKARMIALRPMLREIARRPYNRMVNSLRVRLIEELRKPSSSKSSLGIRTIFGCSAAQLQAHIQGQWKRGMTWRNYGSYWVVDHILPCRAFDLTRQSEVNICFNWQNLRPLTRKANAIKSGTIEDGQQPLALAMV